MHHSKNLNVKPRRRIKIKYYTLSIFIFLFSMFFTGLLYNTFAGPFNSIIECCISLFNALRSPFDSLGFLKFWIISMCGLGWIIPCIALISEGISEYRFWVNYDNSSPEQQDIMMERIFEEEIRMEEEKARRKKEAAAKAQREKFEEAKRKAEREVEREAKRKAERERIRKLKIEDQVARSMKRW